MSIVTYNYCKYNDLTPINYIGIKDSKGHIDILCVVDKEIDIDKIKPKLKDEVFGKKINADSDYNFFPLPSLSKENKTRSIYYISGPSGSGKTTLASKIAEVYSDYFPNRDIYFFSPKQPEGLMVKLKPKVVNVTDPVKSYKNFINPDTKITIDENDENPSELDNSLCIFDDLEGVPDKKVKESLNSIISSILHLGRHRNISCLFLNHLACNNNETKKILAETHNIVFFPQGEPNRQIKYLIDNYCGLSKNDLTSVLKNNPRWVCVHRNYPIHTITPYEVRIK